VLSVEDALECILGSVHGVEAESVPLPEALNRVLAGDVIAPQDVPRFSYATVDGFAIHRHDMAQPSMKQRVSLEVIETVPAGSPVTKTVQPGASIRVMTGALLPPGTNAVVRAEDVSPLEGKTGLIAINRTVKPMENVAPAGETMKQGELVLKTGTILRPERIGALTSLGFQRVEVFRRPCIGLLGTGRELVALGENLEPGKIYASFYYLLMAKLQERGCAPMGLGITGDDREDIQNRIRSGLAGDAMITTGGTGEGMTDWVTDIYRDMAIRQGFDGVAMSPGRSSRFGVLQGKPLFSLPGSPTACMVAFEELVMPAILRLRGVGEGEDVVRPLLRMSLAGRLSGKRGMRRYVPAKIVLTDGRLEALPLARVHRGSLMPVMQAHGLIVIPENSDEIAPGGDVYVRLTGFNNEFSSGKSSERRMEK
jgi:molybdopterin molybdotransferase